MLDKALVCYFNIKVFIAHSFGARVWADSEFDCFVMVEL